jgi:hypothetical protein
MVLAEKSFWQDKWLKDQYNQRNPGQANHPDSRRGSRTVSPPSPKPTPAQRVPATGGKKK